MTDQEILDRFRRLSVWQRGGERAPHKPLLILLSLGEITRAGSRLLGFREIDPVLRELLERFGPPRGSYKSHYPFWRLRNDGVWEVEKPQQFEVGDGSGDARRSDLLRQGARGGIIPEIHDRLMRRPDLCRLVARELLDAHFPSSMHDDILAAVGLDLEEGPNARACARDPEFRRAVLAAYENHCAVCHASIRLHDRTIGLEAAHIKWRQAGGPDVTGNGLALCSLHHKMFDLGAFTLSAKHTILVSEHATGNRAFQSWLARFHAVPARKPLNSAYLPRREFLAWHGKEVFRAPARTERGR